MKFFSALIFLCAAAFFAVAQERPLLTDDVDTVPEGAVELSAGVDFLQNAKFPLSGLKGDLTRVGNVRGAIGFSKNIEFEIEGTVQNYLAINSAGASHVPLNLNGISTNDAGDFLISTKIRLRNETQTLPGVAFKFGFEMPNSDQSKGIGTNTINVYGKFILQKRFFNYKNNQKRLKLMGNLGLGIMSAPLERFTQNDVLLYGFGGVFTANDRVNIVGEINGRQNTRKNPVPVGTESLSSVRFGAQIKASGLRFDSAAIFGLTKNSPRTGLTFGVTYMSPSFFKPAY